MMPWKKLNIIFLLVLSAHSYVIKYEEPFTENPFYHTQENLEDLFMRLQKTYPENAKVHTIGQSIEGRNLMVLQIGQNVRHRNLLTPMVKFIGNMHGDEAVSREMLIYLSQYLLQNYQNIDEISNLINKTEIYIMPTMNPDGFARSKEGNCESLRNYVGRHNAAGMDLNRDFPDRLEDERTIQRKGFQRQPETSAVIQWIVNNPFVLSANFHGGAVVASYPYDNSINHHECCEESLTPDDLVFKTLAHAYSDHHPVMKTGKECNETFTNGVTNGAFWYELNGGMQDFNYAFTNCFELTVELSCCKYPLASTLPNEWKKNKQSLISLLKMAHMGVKGLVQDINGYPISDAQIIVQGIEDKAIHTTKRGEYWRLLTPGTYNIKAVAFGYEASPMTNVEIVNKDEPVRLDFKLKPAGALNDDSFRKLQVKRSNNAPNGFATATTFVHHNYKQMEKFLHELSKSYPSITRLYTIGKSVQGRDLWVMEIFSKPGKHIPGIPEFKYVANMHGNEVVGREMLLYLAKYLCEHYLQDARITNILNSTRLHFLFSMNPDGYELAKEGDKISAVGRANFNDVDLNRNFPDQYGTDFLNEQQEPEVKALMNWTLSLPFALSANLHGGSLVANYPYDDNPNDFQNQKNKLRIPMADRKPNLTDDDKLFKHLAKIYSDAHPTMHLGKPCPFFKNENFPGGITNGAQWYSVTGGMQDWNYIRAGVPEITIEMGCDKFPLQEELPKYWDENREPLIQFIEQVQCAVHGFIRSSIGTPVQGATVIIDHGSHIAYSAKEGDYWRLTTRGNHNITIIADGFETHHEELTIPDDGPCGLQLDIALMRNDPQHWASAYDYRIIENVVHTRYHSTREILNSMAELERKNIDIVSLEHDDSGDDIYYKRVKITSEVASPGESKSKIAVISSMFDATSPMGREIVLNLGRHLVEGYRIKEPLILNLLNNSIIYLFPIMDNFEKMIKSYKINQTVCDPIIDHELAEKILDPEFENHKEVFLRMIENEHFDLILSFTAGNYDLMYPQKPLYQNFLPGMIVKPETTYLRRECPITSTRTAQKHNTQRLTNLFYEMYNVPLLSLGISCCRMPVEDQLATIWRENLEKIMNVMHLSEVGITGRVESQKGDPLRGALVKIKEFDEIYRASKNLAKIKIILPPGEHILEVFCSGYHNKTLRVNLLRDQLLNVGVIKLISKDKADVDADNVINSGYISGFVLDSDSRPIEHAKIYTKIKNKVVSNFTNTHGEYVLHSIPLGNAEIYAEEPHHHTMTKIVTLREKNTPLVFHLKKSDDVMGLPRLVFIFLVGLLLTCFVIIVAFTIQCIKDKRNGVKKYYSFSALPQDSKELFEEDETELFRTPIKKGLSSRPYYDEDVEFSNSDDGDSSCAEDVIILDQKSKKLFQ